ncbi:MAG: type I methionyl aminopeptidase [Elusimicrobia bacterium]|nr:type I methionyl aminopeptidase [Elusimicrobiota bacterium]
MIIIKSPREIDIMRKAGGALSEATARIREEVAEGMTTGDLDSIALEELKKRGLAPAFLNYGYPPSPASICASINDEIVHGIPSNKRVLETGDILSVDIGGILEGFNVDMAFTVTVGPADKAAEKLLRVTREALEAGVGKMYTSLRLGDVSSAIQEVAEAENYSIVRELVGHGIGRDLHEAPNVPNYGVKGRGLILETGLVLAIEPMLIEGDNPSIKYADDEWTVKSVSGRNAAHFENTVAVTEKGPLMITEFLWEKESE